MEEEKQLSGEESLKLITRMIYEGQGYYYESGMSALVYGFSILLCTVLAYMREKGVISLPFSPFYLLIPVFFIQGWLQYKEDQKKKAKTFTDEAIDFVWMGFFIGALATIATGFAGVTAYAILAIILLLAGYASFLTGMLSKFFYLKVSAFICWALGVISFFMHGPNIYLLFAAAAILVWVVPGFMMNAYFKKQQHAGRETII